VTIKAGFPGMAQALKQHTTDVAWLPEPFGSGDAMKYGLQEMADLDQGATSDFPVGWPYRRSSQSGCGRPVPDKTVTEFVFPHNMFIDDRRP
jgi:hypothetical protein